MLSEKDSTFFVPKFKGPKETHKMENEETLVQQSRRTVLIEVKGDSEPPSFVFNEEDFSKLFGLTSDNKYVELIYDFGEGQRHQSVKKSEWRICTVDIDIVLYYPFIDVYFVCRLLKLQKRKPDRCKKQVVPR